MSVVITGAVNCAATVISIVEADGVGRRTLLIEFGLLMLVCQVLYTGTIVFAFVLSGHHPVMRLPSWYSKSLVALMCTYVAGYTWSWGPIGWLVPCEIFPLEIRSAVQSINVGLNIVCTFIIAQIFTFILSEFKFGLFICFMGFVILMAIFFNWLKYVEDENEHGTIGG